MGKLYGTYLLAAAVLSLVVTFTSAADLGKSCTGSGAGDCAAPNAVCDTNCVCKGQYKANADNTTCIQRAVGDSCAQHTDCSTGDSNSECSADNPKKCVCKTDFTAINNVCKKGLNDTCTASAHSECAGVPHAVCKTTDNVCACVGEYKQNGATCVAKAVGDSCTQHTDCSTGDTNSECSTENPKKCVCKTDFTAINNVCKKGLGNTCTDGTSCSAVSNAECVGSPKKCACKANFKEDKGQCSPANGLQTLLSAPGVLLLSFLTIVVTRLH